MPLIEPAPFALARVGWAATLGGLTGVVLTTPSPNIEKREPPVIGLNRHVSVIDFVPGLDGTSHHDAFVECDFC